MTTPAILAAIEARRHWSWETREAWNWLTNFQQMRDTVDGPMRELSPGALALFLQEHDFRQHTWFLQHYYHHQRPPQDDQIDWSAIRDRWLATLPAQTIIPSEVDRAQCSADRWHEYRLLYREDAPLSIYAQSSDDEADYLDAGGGAWIYWRGERIEHYTYPYEQLADARELIDLCSYLEDLGIPVNQSTAVWFSDWFVAMNPGHPYIPLLPQLLCYKVWEHPAAHKIVFTHLHDLEDTKGRVRSLYLDGRTWHKVRRYTNQIEPWKTVRAALSASWLREPFDYHAMEYLGWTSAAMGQGKDAGQLYAPLDGVLAWMQAHNIFPNFLESDGGPWCPYDDADQCPGCAGEIHRTPVL